MEKFISNIISFEADLISAGKILHLKDRVEYQGQIVEFDDILSYEKYESTIKYTEGRTKMSNKQPSIKIKVRNKESATVFVFSNDPMRDEYFEAIDRYMTVTKALKEVFDGVKKSIFEIDDEQKDKSVKKKRTPFKVENVKDFIKNYMYPPKKLPGFNHEEILKGEVNDYLSSNFLVDSKSTMGTYLKNKNAIITNNMKDKNIIDVMADLKFFKDAKKIKNRCRYDFKLKSTLTNLFGDDKFINGKN